MARRAASTPAPHTTNEAVTPADVRAAAALPASPRSPVRKLTSAFVDQLAAPDVQTALRGLSGQLKSYKGCDVATALALVAEGAKLNATADRFENSYARVRQRIVEINDSLRAFGTALAVAQANAPDGSAVSTKLAGFVGRRIASRGTAKGAATRKRNARAKATKGSGT